MLKAEVEKTRTQNYIRITTVFKNYQTLRVNYRKLFYLYAVQKQVQLINL